MTTNEETYGPSGAALYDEFIPSGPDAEAAADVLAEYARRTGSSDPVALELGVGTGRIAIPLARRGIRVVGVDLAPAMLEVLRGKPEAQALVERLTVVIGDMTDPASLRSAAADTTHYDLVYCVLGTLTALPDAAAQRRCLAAAATVLAPDGRLVLEMPVPDVGSFDGNRCRVRHLGRRGDGVWMETARLDPVAQVISFETVTLSPASGVTVQPVHQRYVWPNELDLMAELAGLHLVSRHSGWTAAPFGPASPLYVAVYRGSAQAPTSQRSA